MINLTNMNRQHNSITNEINCIMDEVNKGALSMDRAEAALHISKLAGLLKIHLMDEDKFLYPDLLKSSDRQIKEMTNQYMNEMGNLAENYTEYKNKYNTKSKIAENMDSFILDTQNIIAALKKRIDKEDKELYRFIVDKKL